jgi:hypothetical protein
MRAFSIAFVLIAGAQFTACGGGWRTVSAAMPFAYQDDSAPVMFIVGKGAKPGEGKVPMLDGLPSDVYFDPSGHPEALQKIDGIAKMDQDTKKELAASISASVTSTCSGALGISASSKIIGDATIKGTQTFGLVDTTQRAYTARLKNCCADSSCKKTKWVVNRAYKTAVTWSLETTKGLSLGGNVQCTENPATAAPAASSAVPSPSTSAAPVPSPSASPAASTSAPPVASASGTPPVTAAPNVADSKGAPSAVTAADATKAAAATQTGIGASVIVASNDQQTATLVSEGWNVVELLPLRQLCEDRELDCKGATGALRQQLQCD